MDFVLLPKDVAIDRGFKFYFGKSCKKGHSKKYLNGQCVDCFRSKAILWNKSRPEKVKESQKKYYLKNKESLNKYANEYQKAMRRQCNMKSMKERMNARIRNSLKADGYSKNSSTSELIGCDWGDFLRHIELQFLPMMSWDNRSRWHIDHIIPCSSATSEEELVRLFHFTNLRPIWAKDNRVKSDKIEFLI